MEEASGKTNTAWPISFDRLKAMPSPLKNFICVILILTSSLLVFLAIIAVGRLSFDLLGNDQQRATEAIKSFLPLAAAAIGLPLIIWRLTILNHQAKISEAHAQIDRETQYTSIFSKSVEQLGQTKEIKETKYRNDTLETLARTVANIEVRLGAIHSLTRLAEESARDVNKIINMLLSYVRENSWYDRQGIAFTRIEPIYLPTYEWSSEYQTNEVSDEIKKTFESYMDKVDETAEAEKERGEKTPETRVDVNEATDAAYSIYCTSEKK